MLHRMLIASLAALVGCGAQATAAKDQNQSNNRNQGVAVCGNGIVEVGEQCDDGPANSDSNSDACRTDCRDSYCGDGVVDSDEGCDDGNGDAGDGCSPDCTVEDGWDCSSGDCVTICGDGLATGLEACDGADLKGETCISQGQAQGTLFCNPDCTFNISGCTGTAPVCGNGIVEEGEECDDGNHNNNDACPDGPGGTCQFARCGDGFVWEGHEGCDDGNGINGDLCPDGPGGTCQLATCGDGHVWIGQELCDPGLDPTCDSDCQGICGDGVWNWPAEKCDPGDPSWTDCSADCQSFCGDGVVDPGEECDYANDIMCTYSCQKIVCGDGRCDPPIENKGNCPQDCMN